MRRAIDAIIGAAMWLLVKLEALKPKAKVSTIKSHVADINDKPTDIKNTLWFKTDGFDDDEMAAAYENVVRAVQQSPSLEHALSLTELCDSSLAFSAGIQRLGLIFEPGVNDRKHGRLAPDEVAFLRARALANPEYARTKQYGDLKSYPMS